MVYETAATVCKVMGLCIGIMGPAQPIPISMYAGGVSNDNPGITTCVEVNSDGKIIRQWPKIVRNGKQGCAEEDWDWSK